MSFTSNGKIPKDAKKIHMYNIEDILRPRGGFLEKESLSAYILERLNGLLESWTDPEYGDSVDKQELSSVIFKNLTEEVNLAWHTFMIDNDIEKITSK